MIVVEYYYTVVPGEIQRREELSRDGHLHLGPSVFRKGEYNSSPSLEAQADPLLFLLLFPLGREPTPYGIFWKIGFLLQLVKNVLVEIWPV